jgi:tRNA-intron endonuclease
LGQLRMKANTSRSVEAQLIQASLEEKGVTVSLPENIKELTSRGYGTSKNKKLFLTFCETLFLVGKELIVVKDKETCKIINFQQLLRRYQMMDENAWAKYLIYRDLRSRGYVAREGFGLGIDFRLYKRGEYGTATAKNLVLGIQEGQPISMEDLIRALKNSNSLKKQLILAVLNRRGEVVYYSLSKLLMNEK